MIRAALVSAYATEADARAAFDPPAPEPYAGIWTLSKPFEELVHVFTDQTSEQLEAAGWVRPEEPA